MISWQCCALICWERRAWGSYPKIYHVSSLKIIHQSSPPKLWEGRHTSHRTLVVQIPIKTCFMFKVVQRIAYMHGNGCIGWGLYVVVYISNGANYWLTNNIWIDWFHFNCDSTFPYKIARNMEILSARLTMHTPLLVRGTVRRGGAHTNIYGLQ